MEHAVNVLQIKYKTQKAFSRRPTNARNLLWLLLLRPCTTENPKGEQDISKVKICIAANFLLSLHLETSDLATHASKNFNASNKKHIRAPKRTNHEKNEPQKRTTKRTNPKARTTKRTTKSTNHEKNEPKHESRKARPKSTSPKARVQSTNPAPLFASPPLKATKYSKRP